MNIIPLSVVIVLIAFIFTLVKIARTKSTLEKRLANTTNPEGVRIYKKYIRSYTFVLIFVSLLIVVTPFLVWFLAHSRF